MLKTTALAFLIFSQTSLAAPTPPRVPEERLSCATTREFVTALEFIRGEKLLSEKDARTTASQISEQCDGAAHRFIRVTSILIKSGLASVNAVQTGLDFAGRSDDEAAAFVAVFRQAFLKEYLDLDLNSALKLARSLTTEFPGNVAQARKDFETVVDYCVRNPWLELPLPQCGDLGARIARKGLGFSAGISTPFRKVFEFLHSKGGPNLITGKALQLAEQVVTHGPLAADNFIQAYRYGVSKSGLAMENREALNFAEQMAKRTVRQNQQDQN